MEKIKLSAHGKKILADTLTPVSIYLKIRDRFPKSILLESSDYHSQENSFSFICFNPIAGITVENENILYHFPNGKEIKKLIAYREDVLESLEAFNQFFTVEKNELPFQNGLFGYTSYDAVRYFEDIKVGVKQENDNIPQLFYAIYKNVIAINHFNDEAWLYCFSADGSNNLQEVEDLITVRTFPTFHFRKNGEMQSNYSDESYKELVKKAKEHFRRGDIFQMVLSRRFIQAFTGDEFNVYRALRSISPSPYLFYFDYGSFKIFGSSPEAQLVIRGDKAIINPIAGTFSRTGNDREDEAKALKLAKDPKENAKHTMIVDLARNDLSTRGTDVTVEKFRDVHFYSHVIHLVSTVTAELHAQVNRLKLVSRTFPAGTVTGAPKYKAMQFIEQYENVNRQFYGGAIGFMSFTGDFNHAIIIRSFMSRDNQLHYQAGAGVTATSDSEQELREVYNKLESLNQAIGLAETI